MTQNKRKSKLTSSRSIIDHTTTCPYCGHRILHKNRSSHIKRQHPDRYEIDILTAKLDKDRKPITCSYCSESIPMAELEAHVQKYHQSELNQVEVKVRQKERAERVEKRRRRSKLTRKVEEKVAYSIRVEQPVKMRKKPGNSKRKIVLRATAKKLKSNSNKDPKRSNKKPAAAGPTLQRELTSTNKISNSVLSSFRCNDCGRDVVDEVREQHQMEDFLLRRKARWLLMSNQNTSSIDLCPICGKELPQPAFVSHLEEKHPVFYRYASG